MLKSILTPALIALSLAGVANAGEVSSDAQLAGAAGVAANQYTAAELQNIINARRDNNQNAVSFYVSHGDRAETDAVGVVTPGKAQLAAGLGLNPADYTLAQLTALDYAKISNN